MPVNFSGKPTSLTIGVVLGTKLPNNDEIVIGYENKIFANDVKISENLFIRPSSTIVNKS